MKLHTDFHDYYDNAIGYGVDEKVHYNRFTKEIEIVLKSKNDRPTHRNSGLVGYCGYILPFIKLHKWDKRYRNSRDEAEPKLIDVCYAYGFETYKDKEAAWREYSNDFDWYWDRSRDAKLKQYFANWTDQNDAVFLEHKIPIWVLNFNSGSNPNGIANPKLKDYQFDRLKDSTTAFQEVSMYLANILVEQKEIVVIDDKHRIQQHGFDLKDSFRNTKKRSQ